MAASQTTNGKAFEWATADRLSSITSASINKSVASEFAFSCFQSLPTRTQAEMVKAAGGWVASLSASVRPMVTYWVLFVWSFIHVWFAYNAWLNGAPAVEVFKTMMTPDFSALLSGTINYWFLDRTLSKRGI